jgi:RNA polymerase sigma-70 factor, ECF subfamily
VSRVDTTEFEAERSRLTALAGGILGSTGDADDVVQEAWLRFSRAAGVDDPPAWLTTVVTRLCLDRLRTWRSRSSAEARATANPTAEPDAVDPEADAVLAERIGGAMNLVVDALVPAERAAFILHDVFGYPFTEISAVLGRSDAAVRQLASRARRKLRGAPEPATERAAAEENRRVVDAFLAAARGGEVTELLGLLAPDVVMHADLAGQGMGTEPAYSGAAAVAERFNGARGAHPVVIDGDPGAVWIVRGEPRVAFLFHVAAGLVRAIELIADPDVLATMEIRPTVEGPRT